MRRHSLPAAALALALLTLAACSSDAPEVLGVGGPPAFGAAGGMNQVGYARLRLPDSVAVRVVDPDGRGRGGVRVTFAAAPGSGGVSPTSAVTDANGYARSAWTVGDAGPQVATARIAGAEAITFTATIEPLAAPVAEMLRDFDMERTNALAFLEDGRSRNMRFVEIFDAKLAMLRAPSLYGDILRNRQWVTDSVRSSDGRMLHAVAIFPRDTMRAAATRAVRELVDALPLLESITVTPFPTPGMRIWDGFQVGSAGGGGVLHMEDEGTYQARMNNGNPYLSVIPHEAAHSYIPHESLTQFLELYAYNVSRTGSTDPARWPWLRDWVPGTPRDGVHVLLDVYQLIGRDAMMRAYRAVAAIRPLYGVPLPAAAKQPFIDEAPAPVREQVRAKLTLLTT